MPDLSKLYRFRFRERDQRTEMRIWKVLCERFFQPLIGDGLTVLDLACGSGGFINNIRAAKKYAVDLNPDECLASSSHKCRNRLGSGFLSYCVSRGTN